MATSLGGMKLNISKCVIGSHLRSRQGRRGNEKQNNSTPLSMSLFDKLRARHDRSVKIIIAFHRCSDRFKQVAKIFSGILRCQTLFHLFYLQIICLKELCTLIVSSMMQCRCFSLNDL